MKKWIKNIKTAFDGMLGKNIVEGTQAIIIGGKDLTSIDKKFDPQKEEVKNQAVDQTATGVKILSSGVKLDKTIVDKAFNDSLKNKRAKLNDSIVQGIVKTLTELGVDMATVIAVGSALTTALASGPVGWAGLG